MAFQRKFHFLALALGILAAGCEDESERGDDEAEDGGGALDGGGRDGALDAASSVLDAGQGATEAGASANGDAKVGEFSLQLKAPVPASQGVSETPGFTALLGKVFDGTEAPDILWTAQQPADDCVLLTPRSPFCDPRCGSGSVCVDDGVCQKSPAALSAGTLTVKGLKGPSGPVEFTVEPIRNTYQLPGGVSLVYPAFAEGDTIELAAAGAGPVSAFSLSGKGVAPLVLSSEQPYPIAADQPLALAWTAPANPANSRVHVKLDISHHGGTRGKIECETADDGSLTIPAAMMTDLIELGVAGFPTVVVTRFSTSTTATSVGRIDLRIYSVVERAVEIPGVVSCSAASDCPGGQDCRDDKTCG